MKNKEFNLFDYIVIIIIVSAFAAKIYLTIKTW